VNTETADSPTEGWTRAEAEADLTLWLPGDLPMFFRRCAPADWTGGDRFRIGERGASPHEEPVHSVRLGDPGYFYLATFPVTQAQYRAVAAECDALEEAEPSYFKGERRPVESVSWNDATAWCEWIYRRREPLRLTDREGRERTIGEIRLPREAEWEIACRAGTDTEYFRGDGEAALAEAGWYDENSDWGTHPVGELAPNPWGLYDLHGNVWEWCRDLSNPNAYALREEGAADPEVTESTPGSNSKDRVLRGGSWSNSAGSCRSAFRDRLGAGGRVRGFGFRVCLFPGPVAE